jgi:hypothetical protein
MERVREAKRLESERKRLDLEEAREAKRLDLEERKLKLEEKRLEKDAQREVFQLVTAGLAKGMSLEQIKDLIRFTKSQSQIL